MAFTGGGSGGAGGGGDDVESVRVAIRVRPLSTKEKLDGCRNALSVLTGTHQIIAEGNRSFTYDYVYDVDSHQQGVFEEAVRPLVKNFFEGYNATVLAYGQVGVWPANHGENMRRAPRGTSGDGGIEAGNECLLPGNVNDTSVKG
jgi:hypothetical protein